MNNGAGKIKLWPTEL